MTSIPSREEAFRSISRSASYGNLGLFLGAGFSKAVLNSDKEEIALSWGTLLERASAEMKVDYNVIPKDGDSFPAIASKICKKYSDLNSVDFATALRRFKRKIANLTSWYPNAEKREEYSRYLDSVSPAWVITTNYDLVIEALLTGNSIPLGPNDSLISPTGVVPVYHLHGIRTNPAEIIISQEDYVALFRPNEYRQIKLALTIKESTTLILGYGLGDVNVLTALDWSNNVFADLKQNHPQAVIQVIKGENPQEEPYKDSGGILIIETEGLTAFFTEYAKIRKSELEIEQDEKAKLKTIADKIKNPNNDVVNKFIDNASYRNNLIKRLSRFPLHLISGFIALMDRAIDETWTRAARKGAFGAYNQNLNIILDILTGFDVKTIPPALFQSAAYGLSRVARYIGESKGESWSANKTWQERKGQISKETLKELKNVAEQDAYWTIKKLLKTIDD